MVFFQTSAPTGWTKITTHNDKALRVVSGGTGGSGFTGTGFSSAFTHSHGDTLSAAGHALTESEMPKHFHMTWGPHTSPGSNWQGINGVEKGTLGSGAGNFNGGTPDDAASLYATHSTGGGASSGSESYGSGNGSSHSHSMSGSISSEAITPSYIDVIVCSKS
jgi:hypothetical protein